MLTVRSNLQVRGSTLPLPEIGGIECSHPTGGECRYFQPIRWYHMWDHVGLGP